MFPYSDRCWQRLSDELRLPASLCYNKVPQPLLQCYVMKGFKCHWRLTEEPGFCTHMEEIRQHPTSFGWVVSKKTPKMLEVQQWTRKIMTLYPELYILMEIWVQISMIFKTLWYYGNMCYCTLSCYKCTSWR